MEAGESSPGGPGTIRRVRRTGFDEPEGRRPGSDIARAFPAAGGSGMRSRSASAVGFCGRSIEASCLASIILDGEREALYGGAPAGDRHDSNLDLHTSINGRAPGGGASRSGSSLAEPRSEEHTSELQSRLHLVCRLLLE